MNRMATRGRRRLTEKEKMFMFGLRLSPLLFLLCSVLPLALHGLDVHMGLLLPFRLLERQMESLISERLSHCQRYLHLDDILTLRFYTPDIFTFSK